MSEIPDQRPAFISRYANPHYFGGQYTEIGVAWTLALRQRFRLSENIVNDDFKRDAYQRYRVVHDQFASRLQGRILDVGSRYNALYGLYGLSAEMIDKHNPNLPPFDWDRGSLPYEENSFDTVICLDTLEHLDDPYAALSDLAKVTRTWVIISLPNCWRATAREVFQARSRSASYGLPPERPHDRHKWYFNAEDAEDFVYYNAYTLGLDVCDVRFHLPRSRVSHSVLFGLSRLLPDRYAKNLLTKTVFFCLRKQSYNQVSTDQ